MTSENWNRIEPTEVTKVGFRTIVTKHFELPSGEVVRFDTVGNEGNNDVAVIGLTPEKNVIVSRLFRPGPEKVMIELPGGYVDKGEKPVDAGIREFGEETGYGLSNESEVIDLGIVPQQDAYSNSTKNYFMITNVVLQGKQKLETEETITVAEISIDDLFTNAKTGYMTDAVAILLAHDRLKNLEEDI